MYFIHASNFVVTLKILFLFAHALAHAWGALPQTFPIMIFYGSLFGNEFTNSNFTDRGQSNQQSRWPSPKDLGFFKN